MRQVIVYEAPAIYEQITVRPVISDWPGYSDPHVLSTLLDNKCGRGWEVYHAIRNTPPVKKIGNVRLVTRGDQIRWWLRCKLVSLGVI